MIWVLGVYREGDRMPHYWYFDLEHQYRRAYNHAVNRGLKIVRACEDYLSDYDEFAAWTRREG